MAVHKLNDESLDRKIMDDIKGNDRPKVDKVISGKVKEGSSEGGGNMFADILKPIFSKALTDFIVAAMGTVSDMVIGAVDMKVYGENRHKRKGSYFDYSSISRTSSMSNIYRERSPISGKVNYSAGYHMKEIILESAGDAEIVLDSLRELIDLHGVATVGDAYDLVGMGTVHTDFKYGWDDLTTARRQRTYEGYTLIFPKPRPLD